VRQRPIHCAWLALWRDACAMLGRPRSHARSTGPPLPASGSFAPLRRRVTGRRHGEGAASLTAREETEILLLDLGLPSIGASPE